MTRGRLDPQLGLALRQTLAEVEEKVARGLAELAGRLQKTADATPPEGSDGRRLRRARRIGMEIDTSLGKARISVLCGGGERRPDTDDGRQLFQSRDAENIGIRLKRGERDEPFAILARKRGVDIRNEPPERRNVLVIRKRNVAHAGELRRERLRLVEHVRREYFVQRAVVSERQCDKAAFHVIDSPALAEELRHVEEVAFPSDFPPRLDDKIVFGIERAVLVDYPTSRTQINFFLSHPLPPRRIQVVRKKEEQPLHLDGRARGQQFFDKPRSKRHHHFQKLVRLVQQLPCRHVEQEFKDGPLRGRHRTPASFSIPWLPLMNPVLRIKNLPA